MGVSKHRITEKRKPQCPSLLLLFPKILKTTCDEIILNNFEISYHSYFVKTHKMDPEAGISGEHSMDNGQMPFFSYHVVGKWFVNFQYECKIKVCKKKKEVSI